MKIKVITYDLGHRIAIGFGHKGRYRLWKIVLPFSMSVSTAAWKHKWRHRNDPK